MPTIPGATFTPSGGTAAAAVVAGGPPRLTPMCIAKAISGGIGWGEWVVDAGGGGGGGPATATPGPMYSARPRCVGGTENVPW